MQNGSKEVDNVETQNRGLSEDSAADDINDNRSRLQALIKPPAALGSKDEGSPPPEVNPGKISNTASSPPDKSNGPIKPGAEPRTSPEDFDLFPKTTIHAPPTGPRELLGGLRTKLIAPYLILSLITAMVGIVVITRLVTSSIRERFANQLLEASRVAAESLVRQEDFHLEQLRVMAFTQGVPDALRSADTDFLLDALSPIVLNAGLDVLSVTDVQGREILSIIHDPSTEEYAVSRGSDLQELDLLKKVREGEIDALGDKYAEIIETGEGPYLATAAPVVDQEFGLVGAIMLATQLDHFLYQIKPQVLADLIMLDESGKLLATTLAPPENGYQILELSAETAGALNPAMTQELSLYQRDFQLYYSPLAVRQETLGVLGIALPSNFIVSVESTSRNLMTLIFTLGAMGVIIAGYLLARSIIKPITRLRDISLAVAGGDLEQRTGLKSKDEIGQLAAIFDLMTFRLRKRTTQAMRLYNQSQNRAQELSAVNLRLQAAQQQLIQSEKLASVGQLTAGIVHDVKNPLAVIKGMAEELTTTIEHNPEIVTDLSIIRDNADRANRIVEDLLKFARQSEPDRRTQNLCDTALNALRLTHHLAKKASVQVESNLEGNEVIATYDAQQLEQVFVNLIQNAIQAMPTGGLLRLHARQTQDMAEVSILDSGTGIPEGDLRRIFDPFFTTKPEGEGTGLGLSVCYGLISAHQGRIEVESKLGVGSVFRVLLPQSSHPNNKPPSAEG